jgi:heptaprenyl diphosphate synthase
MLSFSGGLLSTVTMGLVFTLSRTLFGPVGLSIIGAFFHNIAQLALAYVLFIQRIEAVLLVSPVIILIGTLTGLANGTIADILIKNLLKKYGDNPKM